MAVHGLSVAESVIHLPRMVDESGHLSTKLLTQLACSTTALRPKSRLPERSAVSSMTSPTTDKDENIPKQSSGLFVLWTSSCGSQSRSKPATRRYRRRSRPRTEATPVCGEIPLVLFFSAHELFVTNEMAIWQLRRVDIIEGERELGRGAGISCLSTGLFRIEKNGVDPTPNHLRTSPVCDVLGESSGKADKVFDRVGRAHESSHGAGHSDAHDNAMSPPTPRAESTAPRRLRADERSTPSPAQPRRFAVGGFAWTFTRTGLFERFTSFFSCMCLPRLVRKMVPLKDYLNGV